MGIWLTISSVSCYRWPHRAAHCWHSAASRAWSRGACSATLVAELGGIFGGDAGRLSTAASVCEAHGKDESYHAAIGPDAVVFPANTAEVSQVCCSHLCILCPLSRPAQHCEQGVLQFMILVSSYTWARPPQRITRADCDAEKPILCLTVATC